LGGIHLLRGSVAEKDLLHLLVEEILGLLIPGVQAVVIDEKGLMLKPVPPAVAANGFQDPLTQLVAERRAGERRFFRLAAAALNGLWDV
jgi:hypothetical protein